MVIVQVTLEEAESALEQEEAKVTRAQMEVAAVKQEVERRLTEKDEELEGLRYEHCSLLARLVVGHSLWQLQYEGRRTCIKLYLMCMQPFAGGVAAKSDYSRQCC
jgi:hypothetical protein